MRRHPAYTAEALAQVDCSGRSREWAASHHERLDGSGYHRGLEAPSSLPAERVYASIDLAA